MNKNIRITWPAWLWINTTSDIILNIISDLWYEIISDIEYSSRIKWWINYFDINFSIKTPYLSNKVDFLLWFSPESVDKSILSMKEGWYLFINSKLKEKIKNIDIISKKSIKIIDIEINDKYDNTYLLAILCLFLDIPYDILKNNIKKTFFPKWEEVFEYNMSIIDMVYNKYLDIKWGFKLSSVWDKKNVLYWNKSFCLWAIDWWLEYYSAYPMTPASSILSEVINSKKVKYLQPEDEISVINSALWASFTWARSMCWTSWWGFALMSEALSFAIQAEIPITVVLSQRAWPSTWTPTYHEMWDINYALNPSFWDFNHIVLYPSNIEEVYFFWWLALNLADKYQIVVIVLLDKQLSELYSTYMKLEIPPIDRWVILDNPPEDYKRYELNDTWISPRVKVWTKNWDFIATSYEHDEYWETTEDPEIKKLMTEKRFKKLKDFYKKEDLVWYEIVNPKARKIFLCLSATSYTLKAFVKNNPEYWLVIIKILKPLDHRLLDEIKNKDELIFVENNYSGQLENYITKELGLKYIDWLVIKNFRKYNLLPFYYEDFEEKFLK